MRYQFLPLLAALAVAPSALAERTPDLLYPALGLARAACDAGYASTVPGDDGGYTFDLDADVRLQTPLGSVFQVCKNAAAKTSPKPDPASIRLNTIVYLSGRAASLEDARRLEAILLVQGDDGRELHRVAPSLELSRSGSAADWKPECPSSVCKLKGRNLYYFDLSNPPALRADLLAGRRLVVSVARRGASEELVAPAATGKPTATASPGRALFDQAAALVLSQHFGASAADRDALVTRYQGLLDAACAERRNGPCPFITAAPLVERLVAELDGGQSRYFSAERVEASQAEYSLGRPARAGFTTSALSGSSERVVTDIAPGGPASEAGVRLGDKIVAVNGRPLAEFGSQAESALTVAVAGGVPVTLAVVRPGVVRLELTLTGRPFPTTAWLPSLASRPDGAAVIRIPNFDAYKAVGPRVHDLIQQARSAGARAVVVDLRGNSGGLSTECLATEGALGLNPAWTWESRRGRATDGYREGNLYRKTGNQEVVQYTVPNPTAWSGPLAVLVDAGTAGCAGLIAADVQAARRGAVVGEPAASSGTGSRQLGLMDGSAIYLAVATYLRADGAPFPQRLPPGIEVGRNPDEFAETGRDAALERAVEALLTGR